MYGRNRCLLCDNVTPINVLCGHFMQFCNGQVRCAYGYYYALKRYRMDVDWTGHAKDGVRLWFCEDNELSSFIKG
jgi:hypothetical protein